MITLIASQPLACAVLSVTLLLILTDGFYQFNHWLDLTRRAKHIARIRREAL